MSPDGQKTGAVRRTLKRHRKTSQNPIAYLLLIDSHCIHMLAAEEAGVRAITLFDNEEVGSDSAYGEHTVKASEAIGD